MSSKFKGGVKGKSEMKQKAIDYHSYETKDIRERIVNSMKQEGVFIHVTVGRWRGFTKLSPADIGIDPIERGPEYRRVFDEICKLGEKLLFPEEILDQLSSIESSIRGELYALTHPTKLLGRFMPIKNFDKWLHGNEARSSDDEDSEFSSFFSCMNKRRREFRGFLNLTKDYLDKRDYIYENYNNYIEQMRSKYLIKIKSDWCAKNRKKEQDLTENDFDTINDIVERILGLIPNRDDFKRSFQCKYDYTEMPKLESEFNVNKFKEEEERKSVQELVKYSSDMKKRKLDSIYNDVVGNVYRMISKVISEVKETSKESGDINKRSLTKLRNLSTKLGELNFWDDEVLSTQAEDIKRKCNEFSGISLEDNDDERTLSQVINQVETYANEVLEEIRKDELATSFSLLEME